MTGTVHVTGVDRAPPRSSCRRSGFALGPMFEKHQEPWQAVGAVDDFDAATYVPKVITIVAGIGQAGKSTVYVRKRNPTRSTPSRRTSTTSSSRSRRAACTSAARCASSRRPAASSARATAASTTSAARSTAGRRCARSTASTRASRNGQVEIGPRYSVNSELKRFSPRDPGEPLDGIGQYLYPSRPSVRKLPGNLIRHGKTPAPRRRPRASTPRRSVPARATARSRRRDAAKEAGITVVDWVDERTSLTRPGPLADVPQGPQGDQLVLHAGLGDDVRLPQPGGHRRLPGDVLRPVAARARTSRRASSRTTSSSASSCAACTSGAPP